MAQNGATLSNPPIFYACFLQELRRQKWPTYPSVPWHICLRLACEADLCSYRQAERHKLDAQHYCQVGYCQEYRVKEHRESLPPAARSSVARSVDRACDAFLESRGIPVGFHQY